jgi:DNA-binding NarL/FixJ family response regulator
MIKILIVDNNALFREGLTNLLERETGIQVVGEADSIGKALTTLTNLEPDLALVDAELPDMEQFRGIRLLRAQRPHMQILLLSMRGSEDQLLSAIRNGARGYVLKNHSLSTLMASIRAMERGEAVIPRAMVGRLLDEVTRLSNAADADVLGLLTPREVEVLRELSRGSSNREIALNLAIAENTVKVHVHNILEKLNLRNRRQAARLARSHDVVRLAYGSLILAGSN